MESKFELATTRDINGLKLNCYRENGQEDPQEFWMTREQIGQLLEYKNPRRAISDIHRLNKERLNKFSTIREIRTVEGIRTVTREVIMYNLTGKVINGYSMQTKQYLSMVELNEERLEAAKDLIKKMMNNEKIVVD